MSVWAIARTVYLSMLALFDARFGLLSGARELEFVLLCLLSVIRFLSGKWTTSGLCQFAQVIYGASQLFECETLKKLYIQTVEVTISSYKLADAVNIVHWYIKSSLQQRVPDLNNRLCLGSSFSQNYRNIKPDF